MTTEPQLAQVVYYDLAPCTEQAGLYGVGYHSYHYHPEIPQKGHGCPYHVTSTGYHVKKTTELAEVTVTQYVDSYFLIHDAANAVVAECLALTKLVKNLRLGHDRLPTTIITSSEMVMKIVNEMKAIWQASQFKPGGRALAHRAVFERFCTLIDQEGSMLRFQYVPETLWQTTPTAATVLALTARQHWSDPTFCFTTYEPASSYHKLEFEASPLFNLPGLLLMTTEIDTQRNTFYLTDINNTEDLIGDRRGDQIYSVVIEKTPEPLLMDIKQVHYRQAQGAITAVLVNLDVLFNRRNADRINSYGTAFLRPEDAFSASIYLADDQQLSQELKPLKLALRAFDQLQQIETLLQAYLQDKLNQDHYQLIDLTPLLFTWGKKHQELLASIGVTTAGIDVKAMVDHRLVTKKLIFGEDLPTRNHLKKMEKFQPKVFLLIHQTSDYISRYLTITETDLGWCAMMPAQTNWI